MIFGRNKKMIDVRDLQRKGIVKIPKEETVVPTDKQGFVDLSTNSTIATSSAPKKRLPLSFLNKKTTLPSQEENSQEMYGKKEVDQKLVDLDNKLYKLEQRIELLERKAGVGQGSNSNLIGW